MAEMPSTNCKSSTVLAKHYRLMWFIYLQVQGIRRGKWAPHQHSLWGMVDFTFLILNCSKLYNQAIKYFQLINYHNTNQNCMDKHISVHLCVNMHIACPLKSNSLKTVMPFTLFTYAWNHAVWMMSFILVSSTAADMCTYLLCTECWENGPLTSRNSLHLVPELQSNVVNKAEIMQLSL